MRKKNKMPTSDHVANLLEKAESLMTQMQQMNDDTDAADVAAITQQLQQLAKTKQDVKDKFHKTLTINSFMQNLMMPRDQWDTIIAHSEAELQTARVTLKEAQQGTEEHKNKVMSLHQVFAQVLPLSKESLANMENNFKWQVDSYQRIRDQAKEIHCMSPDHQEQLKQLEDNLEKTKTELANVRQTELRLRQTLANTGENSPISDKEQQGVQEAYDHQDMMSLQNGILQMEEFSRVKCQVPCPNTIVVQLPPNQPAGHDEARDDGLTLALKFERKSTGSLQLIHVKSNIDSLDLSDLQLQEASLSSLPYIINEAKRRWMSHLPLLTEINRLRSRAAIDWIPENNILRVALGWGGSVVCSLDIPAGYPYEGQVTVRGISGSTTTYSDLMPTTGNRLEDWVDYLQAKFSKE